MNKYAPHVYVIPEDDADRALANGFVDHHQVKYMRIQVAPTAGGWGKVLKIFRDEYVPWLRKYSDAHVVMLIDFDDQVVNRKAQFENEVPEELKARVFVIGSKLNPERLKQALNLEFERIGDTLASECYAGATEHWDHEHLKHNDAERKRLIATVRPFLFES